MMDDQLEQYIEYLKEEGYSDCNIVDGYIFIKLKIENKDIVLKCNLDSPFPYKFPSIYIVRDRSDEIEAIPHKNGDDSLCLYDTGKAIPNFFEPQRLLLESIQKAERNICVGIKGENQYDFITEFTAYWKSKIVKADSFLNDESKTKQIVWLMRASNTINAIIAESEEQLRHITSMIWKEKDSKGNVHEALCVSLDGSKITEIPENDVQVIRMIMSSAYDAKRYQSFMQKNLEKIKLIIMKIYMPNGIMTIGWVHLAAQQQHGFRKGKANITLAYSNKQTDVGFPIQINDCSQSRLYNRGSDGQPAKWDSVAILGCGSVGSAVAELMMRLGTTDYLLVDNEYLSAENVARHYCGYDLIGLRKTRSIQFMLCHHNPNISCQCVIFSAIVVTILGVAMVITPEESGFYNIVFALTTGAVASFFVSFVVELSNNYRHNKLAWYELKEYYLTVMGYESHKQVMMKLTPHQRAEKKAHEEFVAAGGIEEIDEYD